MFDDKQLWKKRLSETSKEMGRYLRYIFNGHLVVVMLFLLGTAAFYYQEWINSLTPQFPVAFVMSLVIVPFLTYSPTYTFLKQPDKIFLLPVETKLTDYFFRSQLVSIFFQSYILLLLLAALMPMYVQVYNSSYKQFFLLFFIVVGLKSLNVFIRHDIFYHIERSVHRFDSIVRFFINGLALYLLFSQANMIYVFIFIALLVVLYLYFHKVRKEKGINWELLIELEEKRMGSFYRLANLFTDVPKLKERIRRRKWLDWLLRSIVNKQENTYTYLYARTFLRSGDYFGLFIRLTIIGGVCIYFVTSTGQLLFALLFIYLTGFQLMPLRLHHENNLFVELYPVSEEMKMKTFQQILSRVLFIQSLIFTIIIVIKSDWLMALVTLGVTFLFSIVFVRFYSKKTFLKGK